MWTVRVRVPRPAPITDPIRQSNVRLRALRWCVVIESWHRATPLSDNDNQALCPACGSGRIVIATITKIEYEVKQSVMDQEFQILAESIGDSHWTGENSARCAYCDWLGTVADLQASSTGAAGSPDRHKD